MGELIASTLIDECSATLPQLWVSAGGMDGDEFHLVSGVQKPLKL